MESGLIVADYFPRRCQCAQVCSVAELMSYSRFSCAKIYFVFCRKTMERRKHQVRVRTEGGCDPPSGDGHRWRKYGQKEILGDKHPWLAFLFFPDPSKCLLMTFSVLQSGSKPFAFAFGFRRCGSPFLKTVSFAYSKMISLRHLVVCLDSPCRASY